jgi:hypothetical protein
VIDASTFALSYNAFWNAYSPTCEHFVRRLNLGGLDRYFAPMAAAASKTKRRALIAEYAFSLFVERRGAAATFADVSVELQRKRAWEEATRRLAPYASQGLDIATALDDEENGEVSELASRLDRAFDLSESIVLRPMFPGCGYVDASEGDVIFGTTLFEVKTVDRPVRSSDIRQTITYAALNAASPSGGFKIDGVGLFNPRRGQLCRFEIDNVCSEISGRSAQELFEAIIQALSGAGISR